jgi:GTPase SAR1 family protein
LIYDENSSSVKKRYSRILKVIPALLTIAGRQAYLSFASLDEELINNILFDGSTDQFCKLLLLEIEKSGASENSIDPLLSLLDTSKNYIGQEQKDKCSILIDNYLSLESEDFHRKSAEDFVSELGVQSTTNQSNDIYLHIMDLFVKPQSYDHIKQILKEHHIIFILGDPHVGKTYTAIHLLWELYNEGYEPLWIGQSQLSSLFQGSGSGSIKLDKEYLKSGTAVYIEDPFGRSNPVEIQEFVNNLHNLIISAEHGDVRIIITSRTNIFNAVVHAQFAKYIVTISQKLELGKAYQEKDLSEVCQKYIKFYGVSWINNGNINETVEAILKRLSAPHNIELFIRATRYQESANDALSKLNDFSDVALELAKELSVLPFWQKGFLLYIYFFSNNRITDEVTKDLFERAINKGIFGSKPVYPWETATYELNNFLTLHSSWACGFHSFRHPSLEEGFDICANSEPGLAEVIKETVVDNINSEIPDVKIAAFNCFLHYSTKFGNTEWARQNIKKFADSNELSIRESSRRYIILEYDNLFPSFKEEIYSYIVKSWNERYLVNFLIGTSLESIQQKRLGTRLVKTWDDWVRYQIAWNLHLFAEEEELLEYLSNRLLDDESSMIRRAATMSLLHIALLKREPDERMIGLIWKHACFDEDYGVKMEFNRILKGAIVDKQKYKFYAKYIIEK